MTKKVTARKRMNQPPKVSKETRVRIGSLKKAFIRLRRMEESHAQIKYKGLTNEERKALDTLWDSIAKTRLLLAKKK